MAGIPSTQPSMTNDELSQVGNQIGQGTVGSPAPAVLNALSSSQLAALIGGIVTGEANRTVPISTVQTAPIPWGQTVLPPGLYAFDYAPAKLDTPLAGQLKGLKPVIYFCKSGLITPDPASIDPRTPCRHN